jgi:DNA-binding response OmpR family regulator
VATVLIIDDDEILGTIVRDLVALCGYRPILRYSGRDGLACFYETSPDAVVTDILMPDCEGIEIIRKVRNHRPGTPIIAMSAGGRMGAGYVLQTAERMGADFVLRKPFDPGEMTRALHEAVSRIRPGAPAVSG